jgi:heavy metal sensor kinase
VWRLLGSTRARLVVFQVVILALASLVVSYAVFKLVTVPAQEESDAVLYDQWSKIVGGLQLQDDGSIAYPAGPLPETNGTAQVPVEAVVLTRDGVVTRTTAQTLPDSFVTQSTAAVLAGQGGAIVDWADRMGSSRRVYYEQQLVGDPTKQVPVVVVVSRSTAELQATTRRLLLLLAGGSTLVTLVGAALAWLVVQRTLRPVRVIAAAARSIGDRDLHSRVDVPTPSDELGDLKATFNEMLGRLERSFQGMRHFTADASHELRSPLTVIRTAVDVALARRREAAEYEGVLRSVQVEVDHMGRVLDQLLLLAQADAGTLRPLLEEIDVADLLEELAARWRRAAEAKQVGVVARVPDTGTITADPDLLRRALDNLVDNAIRYSPALAAVTVSARQQDDAWLFEVADQGPGVPEDLRETVFRRFVRSDSVRTRRAGGAGLGLALGAAIADAHGGRLTLATRAEPGAIFQLRLPAQPL